MAPRAFSCFCLGLLLVGCGSDEDYAPPESSDYVDYDSPCDFAVLSQPANASTACDTPFDKNKIRVCPFVNDRTQVVVSGVPGAVEANARIEVHNFNNNANELFMADIDGSFGGLILGKLDDAISVSARYYNCLPKRTCFIVKECDW